MHSLFQGLNDIDAATARRRFEVIELREGQELIKEGEIGKFMAAVVEGTLEVVAGDMVVGQVEPGTLIGELGLFEDTLRTATVRAAQPATLWKLHRTGYEELRDTVHPICKKIEEATLDSQVQRLAEMGRKVAELGLGIPTVATPPSTFFAAVQRLFGAGDTTPSSRGDALSALLSSPLFTDAPVPVLDSIAAEFRALECRAGAFLCTEGEVGHRMFVLESGAVEVIVSAQDTPHQVSTLGPGAAFGMVSLARQGARIASCVAQQGAVVHELDLQGWQRLIGEPYLVGSTFRRAVIRAFSDQLRYTNQQLADWKRKSAESYGLDAIRRARRGLAASVR